ncbi:hypothetical protein H920_15799 [Fukomys damarensis]|uniref:Uncharacterized protein n=1 Tax=Fukomys damarensis TaxID=885580 RepID=A0A091CW63_FUKDA|nr:hypothetical protein H920_15799 [Fukomys damarensis]
MLRAQRQRRCGVVLSFSALQGSLLGPPPCTTWDISHGGDASPTAWLQQLHLEKLTIGITHILESSPGVTKVTIIEKAPAEHHMISLWEQQQQKEPVWCLRI